mmetsp:Transcript_58027/g.188880  ORF Transcript_58027/g.188880 Transcript_58027/m.188880 type:complete len:201 (+) Transcript_58027:89-691(+)
MLQEWPDALHVALLRNLGGPQHVEGYLWPYASLCRSCAAATAAPALWREVDLGVGRGGGLRAAAALSAAELLGSSGIVAAPRPRRRRTALPEWLGGRGRRRRAGHRGALCRRAASGARRWQLLPGHGRGPAEPGPGRDAAGAGCRLQHDLGGPAHRGALRALPGPRAPRRALLRVARGRLGADAAPWCVGGAAARWLLPA